MAVSGDYYSLLGVARTASESDLKRAYRELAKQCHPDLNPGDAGAEERFKQISEAYAVLSDPEKRQRYDRYGARGVGESDLAYERAGFRAVSDLLEGIASEFFGGGRHSRVGHDIEAQLILTFEEAALGCVKTIEVKRTVTCSLCEGSGGAPGSRVSNCESCSGTGEKRFQRGFFSAVRPCGTCQGSGKRIERRCPRCQGKTVEDVAQQLEIKIPRATEDGTTRSVAGQGHPPRGGGQSGDLHILVRVAPHDVFSRSGNDILVRVPVTYPQVTLGSQVDVPTLDGSVRIKVPPATPSGKVLRVKGKGIPHPSNGQTGDLLVTLEVAVPAQVSGKQRKLIEELAGEFGEPVRPKGFLGRLKDLLS